MLSYEAAVNMLDDAVVMAMAGIGLYSHMDAYSAAVIVGKVVKMCYQFYLEGWMFQEQGQSVFELYYPPQDGTVEG